MTADGAPEKLTMQQWIELDNYFTGLHRWMALRGLTAVALEEDVQPDVIVERGLVVEKDKE